MKRSTSFIIPLLLLILSTACGSSGHPADPIGQTENVLPAGCHASMIQSSVKQLFSALNQGDKEQFARMVSPSFEWVKIGSSPTAYSLDQLPQLLDERHNKRDRRELIEVTLGPGGASNRVGVTLLMQVSADDLGTVKQWGKAEINCTDNRLHVLAI